MKELHLRDYQNLRAIYLGGSFSEMKVVYHNLKVIKEEVRLSPVKLNLGNLEFICDSERKFFSWVKEFFSNMLEYLEKDSIQNVFNENEFTRFKSTCINPEEIPNIKIQRIKRLEIWGEQKKIKQNYQKVEEVCFKEGVITFYLSNNAFLQVWNPSFLCNSDYSLQIKNANKIALTSDNEVMEYFLTDGNQLKIMSNKKKDISISCSSVLIKALEIIK